MESCKYFNSFACTYISKNITDTKYLEKSKIFYTNACEQIEAPIFQVIAMYAVQKCVKCLNLNFVY